MLKYEGWEVFDLTDHDFKQWTYHERTDNVKAWLREAIQRQKDKGILPQTPIEYV